MGKTKKKQAKKKGSKKKASKKPAAKKPVAKAQPAKKEAPKAKKMSGLDAAAKVLAEAKEPLNTRTMVERALAKGYWKTGGKTPAATIYAAILREMKTKGKDARFKKTGRGKFALAK